MKSVTALFRVCGWAAVVLITILSLVPGEARPHTTAPSQLERVAAYAIAGSALALGYFGVRSVIAIAALLPIYAALLEIFQLWVPRRTARIIDIVAGTAGSWIGICSMVLLRRMLPVPTVHRRNADADND
jgi:ribose/xylose/arabinose/galactoside ABC-type transport system permease subunit